LTEERKFRGTKLKKLRCSKKIKMKDFPYLLWNETGLRITRQAIEKIEAGKSTPKATTAYSFCSLFDEPISYFFE